MREVDEKILEVYKHTILNERKFDLGSGHLGNGITVWNRAREVRGDYEKIAHIDPNRKITYYIKKPPKEVIDYVEKIANGKNMSVSSTQSHMKVFNENNDVNEDENFIDDSKIADSIFKELEIATNDIIMKTIIPKMKSYEDKIGNKYKLSKGANMFVRNFGVAYVHDIFRQLIGQEMLSVSGALKKISRK